MGFQEHHL